MPALPSSNVPNGAQALESGRPRTKLQFWHKLCLLTSYLNPLSMFPHLLLGRHRLSFVEGLPQGPIPKTHRQK